MLETGKKNDYSHMTLIMEADGRLIKYIHSRKWPSEGKYGHGVYKGEIRIINPNGGLLEQEWTEKGKQGEENETYSIKAKMAKVLEIRRLNIK